MSSINPTSGDRQIVPLNGADGGVPAAGESQIPATAGDSGDSFVAKPPAQPAGGKIEVPNTVEGLVAAIAAGGMRVVDTGNLRLIFLRALDNLKRVQFKPQNVDEGETPPDKSIASMARNALRAGFFEQTGRRVSGGDQEIRSYLPSFTSFVRANARAIGLIGKRPPKEGGGRTQRTSEGIVVPSPETVAIRVLTAASLLAKIESNADGIPSGSGARGEAEKLLAEARGPSSKLLELGNDEKTVVGNLRLKSARADAMEKMARLAAIRDETDLILFEATMEPDWAGADLVMERISGTIEQWVMAGKTEAGGMKQEAGNMKDEGRGTKDEKPSLVARLPAGWQAGRSSLVKTDNGQQTIDDREQRTENGEQNGHSELSTLNSELKEAVRTYVAFWLAERPGGATSRITHSQHTLKLATLSVCRNLKDNAAKRALAGEISQIVSYIVRIESRRDGIAGEAETDTGEKASDVRTAKKSLIQPSEISDAIGGDLFVSLNEFYTSIRDGQRGNFGASVKRRDTAQRFYRLFAHYVRYASGAHGNDLAAALRSNGIEPRIVQAIYLHGGEPFDPDAIEMLRLFFGEHIRENPPEISDLIPAHIRNRMVGASPALQEGQGAPRGKAAARFLPYRRGTGVREFMAPIRLDTKEAEEFRELAGITYQSFLNWGSVRPNPGQISEKAWEAMAAFAEDEGRLKELLLEHRPPHINEEEWKRSIAESSLKGTPQGAEQSKLLELAFAMRPTSISDDEWNDYIERLRRANRLEDATVEPRQMDALTAILPAYHFMRDKALEMGLDIDFGDYLSSIYPIARRLRERAEPFDSQGSLRAQPFDSQGSLRARDGAIIVMRPDFMQNLPYYYWRYKKWAEQILHHGLATGVHPATFAGHTKGSAEQIEYWNIRRYTGPLSRATGDVPGQDERLYEFAFLMRIVPLLNSAMRVIDTSGSLVTSPPTDTPSRYHIQMADDTAQYAEGIGFSPESARGVFSDVRRGIFQGEMNFVEAYLAAIRNVPIEVNLTGPDGEKIQIEDLTREFEELSRQNLIYASSVLDTSPMAAYRSDEENNEIREFYLNLRKYARRVTFGTHVRGTIETPRGPVSFQTIPRIPGQNIVLAGGEHITVLVDDLARIASEEKWSKKRLEDAFRMRVLASYARATGEMDAEVRDSANIRAAVEPYWPQGSPLPAQAIGDHIRLEEMAAKDLSKELGMIPPTARPTGGAMTELAFGPFLPARRVSPEWREQFAAAADSRGLSGEAAGRGIAIIEDYLMATRGFYRFFWPNTLRRIAGEHAAGEDEASSLYDAIVAFLPTIGAASELPNERRFDSDAKIELQLARFVVEDYASLFPRLETAIPEDMRLLSEIAARHIGEHAEALPRRSLVVSTARQLLGNYNAGKENARWVTDAEDEPLHADGLLKPRLDKFASSWKGKGAAPDSDLLRRAYFRLLPRLRKAGEIERAEILSAMKEASGGKNYSDNDIELLAAFIEMQAAGVRRAVEIIADPDIGVGVYLRGAGENFSSGLASLATGFAVSRLLENLPTDINSASLDVVGEELAPFDEASEWMAGWHKHELTQWLSSANEKLNLRARGAIESLELVGADTETPPEDFPAFLQMATDLTGEESFEAILAAEQDAQLLGELVGVPHPRATLAQAARRIYDTQVAPNQAARARRLAADEAARARRIAEMEAELKAIVERVEDARAKSAEIYAWLAERPDIETMAEDAADALVTGARLALERIGHAQDDVLSLALVRDRAAEIASALERNLAMGEIPAIDSAIESADTMLTDARKHARTWRAEADARIKYIREEKDAQDAIREARKRAEEIREEIEKEYPELAGQPGELHTLFTRYNDLVDSGTITHEKFQMGKDIFLQAKTMSDMIVRKYADGLARLARLRDGREGMRSASDILNRARKLESRGIMAEKLRAAAEELSFALGEAEKDIESSRRAILKIQDAISDRRTSLEAGEDILPLTQARGLPDTSPLPESGVTDDGMLLAGEPSRENIHHKAIERLRELILEPAHDLVRPDGTYLVTKSEAMQVTNWKQGGRKGHLTLRDIFGNDVKISAGEWGVRVARTADSREPNHPFAALFHNLSHAIKKPSATAELLYRLATKPAMSGQGEEGRLLRNLFATLSRAGRVEGPGAAESLIQRWATANRDALTHALGRATMARLFVQEVYKVAGAPGAARLEPKRPPIYPKDYTPEKHAASARIVERLLEHTNEVGFALEADGKTHNTFGTADYALGREFAQRQRESLDFYDHNEDRAQRLDWRTLDEINARPVFSPRAFGDTSEYQRTVLHRIYNDPALMELGWLLTQSPFNADIVHKILQPIFRTPPGREAPMSLRTAQELAIAAWQDRKNFSFLFVKPDKTLAGRFPEIAHVDTTSKCAFTARKHWETDELAADNIRICRIFPELMPMYMIMVNDDLVIVKQEAERAVQLFKLLSRLSREAGTYETRTDAQYNEAREAIESLYEENRPGIIEAFKKEAKPDMTRARVFTGFDNPWDIRDPNSWDAFSPTDRMRMMAPELFEVRSKILKENRENLDEIETSDATEMFKYRNHLRMMKAFANTFPEFGGAAIIDDILLGDSGVEADHDLYKRINDLLEIDFFPSSFDFDRDAYLRRFAEAHTSPEYIGHLRRVMQTELGGTSKNLLRSEILIPSSETRKMSKESGGVARGYVDGFFAKSDEVAAEGAKLQPEEIFRGAPKSGNNYAFARLKKIHGGKSRQTVAHLLTGKEKPWLPKIEAAGATGNPSATGVEAVRAPIFGPEYSEGKHIEFAARAAERLQNSDYVSPLEHRRDVFHYRFFGDPGLAALGFQLARDWKGVRGAKEFNFFIRRLVGPLANTPANQTPPFSPYEAQGFLLKWHNRLFDGQTPRPELETIAHPLFTEPNAELAKTHPETALVGAWQIAEIMEEIEKHPIEEMPSLLEMMTAFPDLAGAFTIMAVAPEALDSNAHVAIEAFAGQCRLLKKAGKDTSRVHAEFVDIYNIYAEKAGTALLSQEIYPGMTRARWLTGLDEPWKAVPRTWNDTKPLEQLAILFPESQKVRPGFYRGVAEALKKDLSQPAADRKIRSEIEKFIERFPEFEGAVVIDQFLPFDRERRGKAGHIYEYIAEGTFGMLGSTSEEIVERFVRAHTDPAYLAYIRELLAKPVSSLLKVTGRAKDNSFAKILTGLDAPHLPKPFDAGIWGDPDKLLPASDLERIGEMTDEEINSRIDALGILPRNPLSLARMIREMEGDADYKDLTPDEFSRARLYQKIRCVARLAGEDGELLQRLLAHLRGRIKKIPDGSKKIASPSTDYEFLVKNRAQIIAAAQKARDERTEAQQTTDDRRRTTGEERKSHHTPSVHPVRPPIYSGKYAREEHEKLRLRAAIILKEPRASQLLVEMKDGGSYGFYVDPEEHAGHQRLPASFDVLDEETGIWRRQQSREALPFPKEVMKLELGPRFSADPIRHSLLNLFHEIYSDPDLMGLGHLVNDSNQHYLDEALSFFYTRFWLGIAYSAATGMNPPMTLHEAQWLAAEIWLDYRDGGGKPSARFAAIFAKPDKALVEAYPVTGSVGIWQLNEIIRELEAHPIEDLESIAKMMTLLPEFAGALAVVATVAHALKPDERDALKKITELCSMLAEIQPVRNEKFIEGTRDAIVEFFDEAGPSIQQALAREIYPGMTYTRFLTGSDDAWEKFPAAWDDVETLKKLAALMPESQRVKPEVIHRYRDKVVGSARRYPGANNATAHLVLELDNFADEFPELAGALCISSHLMMAKDGRIFGPFYHFADDYIAARAGGAAIDKNEWTRRFVDMCTDPKFLSVIREWLDKPLGIAEFEASRRVHGGHADEKMAHLLTSSDTPWINEPRDEGIFGDPEKLLPPLDIEGKTPREIEVWINEKIDALRIMPRTTIGLQRVVEVMRRGFVVRGDMLLADGTLAASVETDENEMPVTFAKILRVISRTIYTKQYEVMFRDMLGDTSGFSEIQKTLANPWEIVTPRAYEFLHKNRAEIIARAREIANSELAGGGPDKPGGSSSPAAPAGGGGSPASGGGHEARSTKQEAGSRKQEVRGMKHEAGGRRHEARSGKYDNILFHASCLMPHASESSSSVPRPPDFMPPMLPQTSGMAFINMMPPMMPMPMVAVFAAL